MIAYTILTRLQWLMCVGGKLGWGSTYSRAPQGEINNKFTPSSFGRRCTAANAQKESQGERRINTR